MPELTATQTLVRAACGTHPGLRRENNEDRCHADASRGLFLVIDGVGGHAAGERAADIALTAIRARLERETGAVTERVREAIALANNEIFAASQAQPELAGMACVLTVAVVRNGRATIGHVGDSRLYKLRPGTIQKITRDHSPVGDREDRGELSEREAMRHPRRNEIYRDVGSAPHAPDDPGFVDIVEVEVEPDSALLLCSDGLSDLVPAARIAEIAVGEAGNPQRVVDRLIHAAIEAGGKDNVTVVFAEGDRFAPASHAWLKGAGGKRQRAGWLAALDATTDRAMGSRYLALMAGAMLGAGLLIAAVAWSDRAATWVHDLLPAGTWPRIWVVNADGTGDATTIGEALERARSGDTIRVEPGDYAERVVLAGAITLVSTSPRGATILPAPNATEAAPAVELQATGARFSGFRIAGDRHAMSVGIRLRNAHAEVDNVEIVGARVAAIDIAGAASPVVRACYIHHNVGCGVRIGDGASPRVSNNVVADNGRRPDAPVPAIEVAASARPMLFGNIIVNNGIDTVHGLTPAQHAELLRDNIIGRPGAAPPVPGQKPAGSAATRKPK